MVAPNSIIKGTVQHILENVNVMYRVVTLSGVNALITVGLWVLRKLSQMVHSGEPSCWCFGSHLSLIIRQIFNIWFLWKKYRKFVKLELCTTSQWWGCGQWWRQLWEFTRTRQGPEKVCQVLRTKV